MRTLPEIGRIAGWADTAATLTDLRQRRIRGNAVLTVSLGPQRLRSPAALPGVIR